MRYQPTPETGKADEALKKRNWKDAEDSFQRIVTRLPQHIEAYIGLSETQAILGHFTASLQTLWQAVKMSEQTSQIDLAQQIITRILELKPDHEQALQKRIDLYLGNQGIQQGIAHSRELAQWHLENDHVETAIKLLLRCFQLLPQDLELTLVLAEAYLTNGQMREATGLFRQVISPYLEAQDWEKASDILRRLTLLEPTNITNLLELSDLYIKQERFPEAEQQLRLILRTDLNHYGALLRLAQVLVLKKQFRDALVAYNRIMTLNPDDAEAQEGLGFIYKGQGMPSEAAKFLLMAGLAHLEKNVKDRAQSCFIAVLELDPANNIASRQIKILRSGVE